MLSFIRLGVISLVLIAASFVLVNLSIAGEKPLPTSGVLSDQTVGDGQREIYQGDVIAYKQYRASGYVSPSSGSMDNIIGRLGYWTALNEGDVVFIDIGSNKGAKVGDHFSIINKGIFPFDILVSISDDKSWKTVIKSIFCFKISFSLILPALLPYFFQSALTITIFNFIFLASL